MRLPLTGLMLRSRWLAVVTVAAVVMLAIGALAPAARAGGPDGTLCRQNTARVHIPSNFTVSACFDGKILSLRNRTSAVLRVYATGDIQRSSRFATTPSVATLLTGVITESDIVPPDSELQLWIGSGTADVQIEVATQANAKYALYALLLSYLPGVGSYEAVAAAEESISADIANALTCSAHATNWLGKIGCAAGFEANIQFAVAKMLAQVGIDVAKHAGVIVDALVNTDWLGWDQMNQTNDLKTIAASTPTLHIAAASGTAAQGGGSGSGSGPVQGSSAPAQQGQPAPQTAPDYHGGFAAAVDKYATGGDSGHKGPGNQYAAGPTYPAGTTIHIYCYVNGQAITNSHYNDTTTVWDLSDDGYWYTDAWLFTNSNGPVVPACGSVNAPVDKYATGGDSGHKGPGNQYAAGPTYPAGTTIHIYCYVNGQAITNSHYNDTTTVWDLSDDGYWYTDAWLFTNSNGPVVPACK